MFSRAILNENEQALPGLTLWLELIMTYAALKKRLAASQVAILDGATGTELERRGVAMDPAAWCGAATLGNDAILTEIHTDYIAAGADIITANTYAASRLMLNGAGLGDRVEEIVTRAVAAAQAARDKSGRPEVVVAGSLSHMVPVAAGSDVVDPAQVPSKAAMSDAFHEVAGVLKSAGVELILLEMMYAYDRVPLVVEAALSTGLPVWFGASARRLPDGRLGSFDRLETRPLDDILAHIPASGIDAAGIMHTGAELIEESLAAVRQRFAGPLTAYPDSGFFEMPGWRFVDIITPERYQTFAESWIAAGAQVIGGCCGLGVDHVKAAVRARARAQAS
jgi:S-methylmethionine-dependent homocysteine/selenocysteine methylase